MEQDRREHGQPPALQTGGACRLGAEPGSAATAPVTEHLTELSATERGAEHGWVTRRSRTRWGRFLAYLLTVFLLITLTFVLPRAMPGDPLLALIDPGATAYVQSEAMRAELAEYYGLDRSLGAQYVSYLTGLAQGDLGTSIRYNRPVAELVAERLPWTLLLIGTAMAVSTVVGLAAGVHSAWRRGRRVDSGLLSAFLILRNFPPFFLASIAVYVFAVQLGWVPLSGARAPFTSLDSLAGLVDIGHHLALPALVLTVQFAGGHYLIMRAGMVSELGADYLQLGRAKGLRARRLKYRYAARNALLPVVTRMAMQIAFAVTGSIFVETVFSYPGMGRLTFDAVAYRDYPTLQASFLVLALLVVTANYLSDVLYSRLDPRTTS